MTLQAVGKELAGARMSNDSLEAQASTMIRLGGGLHMVRRHIIVEAQFESLDAATWLQGAIEDYYRHSADVLKIVRPDVSASKPRYSVRVVEQGGPLALETRLIRLHAVKGHAKPVPLPVRGLPVDVSIASDDQLQGVIRGAFLAGGILSDPERSSTLEFVCPGDQTAEDLMVALKRLGYASKVRQSRSQYYVTLHDSEGIRRLLDQIGAKTAAADWGSKRLNGAGRGQANRLANFDNANMRRSTKAAVAACQKVRHSFEVLGAHIPDSLRQAGELRLRYPSASLEELGQKADPPITKDAIAGRIRRLFQLTERYERRKTSQTQ